MSGVSSPIIFKPAGFFVMSGGREGFWRGGARRKISCTPPKTDGASDRSRGPSPLRDAFFAVADGAAWLAFWKVVNDLSKPVAPERKQATSQGRVKPFRSLLFFFLQVQ